MSSQTQFTLVQKESFLSEKADLIQTLQTTKSIHVKILLNSRVAEIDAWLAEFEKTVSNYSNFMNYLLESESKSVEVPPKTIFKPKIALTYAPPQVGKTNAIITIVKDCISKGISVVISSDNKKDQMSQLFSRLIKVEFEKTFITTVDNKNFNKVNQTIQPFIICCLDNKSQIGKVYEKIATRSNDTPMKLCLIHDEADTITKARNITEVMSGQPESHKKWIEFVNNCVEKGIDIKRVFVTATPENVIYLHKPGYVWELPIPTNYVSSDQIHFNELNEFDNKTIMRILTRETKAREKDGGIILYCVERNKEETETGDDDERATQNSVFYSLLQSDTIKKIGLDVISIYNSNGFKFTFRQDSHQNLFINKLEELGKNYSEIEDKEGVYTIKKNELSIAEFYGLLQTVGCKVVLTIGKDLIARGISFVSNHTVNPLTATTMIYKPGSQLSQVAITQAIGRLCGTAQPHLARRLYTTDDVYTNYMTFNRNQREIISAIREHNSTVTDSLIANIALWKASRSVDRKALKLEQDMMFWEDPQDEGYVSDDDRMKSLIDRWWDANTLIGKVLRFVYNKPNGIGEEELKTFMMTNGSTNAQGLFEHLVNSSKTYKLIFKRDNNNITKIHKNALDYIAFKYI